MAPRSNTSQFILTLLFLIATFLCLSKANSHLHLKETNLTFYIQDDAGTNGTTQLVTGIAGHVWSFFSFGTFFITNDPITVGPQKYSPQIGRFQGIYTVSSSDAVYGFYMYSFMFTNQEYNGSTLQVQGRSFNLVTPGQTFTEMAVVGGTGKFRFASGFVIVDFISYDTTLLYSVFRCNVTVLHY